MVSIRRLAEEVHRTSIQVVVFDMDSTLVDGEGIDLLAETAAREPVPLDRVVGMGDGANHIPMRAPPAWESRCGLARARDARRTRPISEATSAGFSASWV
jgi:hypothetical protein